MDQTRGILTHITQTCPGRHHAEMEYVTGKLPVCMAHAGNTLKDLHWVHSYCASLTLAGITQLWSMSQVSCQSACTGW